MRLERLFGMVLVAIVATAFVILTPRRATPSEAAAVPEPEKPWLSRDAEAEIFGGPGSLGPLFAGVTLGGSPPSAEIRERVATFARANDVSIDFDVVDDELVAIRFSVTFGGCCGYEGIDLLARRLGQPSNGGGCGMPKFYYDNWAIASPEADVHMRAAVHVNRLDVRWERTLSFAELAARAEQTLGVDRGTLADAAGDRWHELELGKRYLLELPYGYTANSWEVSRALPADRGITLVTDRRVVTEVTFSTPVERDELRARWGKPRVIGDDEWLWYRGDHTITTQRDGFKTIVTIAKR